MSNLTRESQLLFYQSDNHYSNLEFQQERLTQAIDILYAGDFQQRWDVAKIFPKLGLSAINPLQKILLDEAEELEIRWFALKILGEFPNVEVILTLVELLETTQEEELISLASSTFAKQGQPAIKALANFLQSPSHKLIAAKALAQIRLPEIVPSLLSIVKDEDVQVRLIAIEALSNFKGTHITQILIEALDDYSSQVRKEAVMSLGLRMQSHPHPEIIASMAKLLTDLSIDVSQQTAIALSRINTPSVTSILFDVLQDSSTPILLQVTIIRCLGWIETKQSLQCLNEALFLLEPKAILEIIIVLGRVNNAQLKFQAGEILLNFYYSSQTPIQNNLIIKNLVYAWRQLGCYRAKKVLLEMQTTNDTVIKTHVDSALKAIS